MAARIKKVQVQARRRGRMDDSQWFPALLGLLLPETDAARFLRQNANNMIFEYRVVPASKKLPA